MHEIGIVRSMCKTVLDYAKENNVKSIKEIVVEIGELSLVIPQYVEDLYPPVVANFPELKDTKLIIKTIPGLAECNDCDEIFNVIENEGYCPNCGSFDKEVLSGRDFNIREIHVAD
ncbi:MAG: hydrogenase maturation nickel metallochaperone HypA [Candidatus Limivicinus sp.]|jgi:hydrogenase nickel incorporation protein HypA/HybF